MVLWNGLSFLLSHFSSFYILPVCLSVSFSLSLSVCACQLLTESNTTCQESAVWTDMR